MEKKNGVRRFFILANKPLVVFRLLFRFIFMILVTHNRDVSPQSSTSTFHIQCSIWVKFGIRGVRLMLLSVYEFGESRRRETVFFLSEVMLSGVRVYC